MIEFFLLLIRLGYFLCVMNISSQIRMSEGLGIGYKEVLGEVEEEILLDEGNHYLLARNGRGKTTLLRTLAGVLKPRKGVYNLEGCVKFVPEDIYFNNHLTPSAIIKALVPKKRQKECFDMAGRIELDVKKTYGTLSTGNQRKVSLLIVEYSSENQGRILLLDFLEYWDSNQAGICRLISCHPDFDSMDLSSVIMISDGVIRSQLSDDLQTWKELRTQLA